MLEAGVLWAEKVFQETCIKFLDSAARIQEHQNSFDHIRQIDGFVVEPAVEPAADHKDEHKAHHHAVANRNPNPHIRFVSERVDDVN